MTIQLCEMTREQIRRAAPNTVAVLPTAAIEQHGPHLPVWTDSLICEAVARRAAERAADQAPVVVAPLLPYGSSHHHFPFPGVLSLTSQTYTAAVIDILESLVKSGFRKLVILNGHGGNSHLNATAGLDLVNRLGHPVAVVTGDYWELARQALLDTNLAPDREKPGHAGHFETCLVLALRPDLVDRQALAAAAEIEVDAARVGAGLQGGEVAAHGVWAASPGYTDAPATATAEAGQIFLEAIVQRVADFLAAFHRY